jgi:flagellar biosynthesis protein FliR
VTLNLNLAWITAVLFCSLRLSALLLLTPILQAVGLPVRIRVLLILMLSVSLVSGMHLTPTELPTDLFAMIASGANEVVIGGLMAYGVFVAFAAFSFAGNLLDVQIGFNIANIFDPITRSQSPLIASLLSMLAVALFFTMDAHHTLFRGVAYSLDRIPLGTAMQLPDPATLAKQFGSVFSLGLLLAAPPLFALFLVQIGLAVLSRSLPQLNIFMLSMPINIVVGLSVLAYVTGQYGSVATKIFDSMFNFWEGVL